MKVQNGDLYYKSKDAIEGLVKVVLPAKVSFELVKVLRNINDVIEDIETTKNKILESHADRDENENIIFAKSDDGEVIPNRIKIKDPSSYEKEMNDLMNIEVDIQGEPISIEMLGDAKIEVSILDKLFWLFVE